MSAIRDVAHWLDIPQTEAIRVCGVRERTFYHWQKNPDVKPRFQETDNVSRVRAAFELLVAEIGEVATRRWIREGSPSRLTRILDDPESFGVIEDEVLTAIRERAYAGLAASRLDDRIAAYAKEDARSFARSELTSPDPLTKLIIPGELA